jgi:hypothetical protein
MLDRRVGALEADMKDVKATLGRLELAFARVEEKFTFVPTKEDLTRVEAKLAEKIATIDGRISNLPTTWQIIAILSGLIFGVAALVYGTTNFIAQKPAITSTQTSQTK